MASGFLFMGLMEVLMMGVMGGGQGVPLPVGLPPTPEDPKLSQIAPADAPLIYITWAGTAKADADSANHTEKILADPQVKHLLKSIEAGINGMIAEETKNNPQEALLGKNLPLLIKNALFNPAAIYVEKVEMQPPAGGGGPPKVIVEAGFVVNMGKDINDAKKAMDALEGLLVQETGQKMKVLPAAQGGLRQFALPPDAPSVAWGVEGNYLIFAIGDNSIKRLRGALTNGRTPKWLSDARKKITVDRISSFTYANAKLAIDKVVPMFFMMVGMDVGPGGPGRPGGPGAGPDPMAMYKKVTTALGLDKMSDIVAVTGFDDEGYVSKTLVGVSADAGGLFKLAEGKPLTAADLGDVPADADVAHVSRLDAKSVWDELLKVIAAIDPNAAKEFKNELAEAEEDLGFKIKEDLIDALGDTISIYNSPSEGGLVFTGLTGVVKLKDSAKAQKVVDRLAKIMDEEFNGHLRNNPNRWGRRAYEFKKFTFLGETIHYINPIGDDWVVAPAWSITKDRFVIAPFPQMVKAHIARVASKGKSLASQPKVKAVLDSSNPPLTISYVDMKTVFPKVYAALHPMMTLGFAELQSEGFKMDMSALPSASAFTKHLDKSIGFASRTKAGVYFENRARLPIGGVGSVAPMLVMGGMMPMMAYQRNVAMEHAHIHEGGHPNHGGERTTAPAVRVKPTAAAMRAKSMNQLRQIGVSIFLYHAQKNKAPDSLADLGDKAAKLRVDPWGQPYVYLGKGQTPAGVNSSKTPMAATNHLINGKRLALYGDGHVELIDDAKFKAQCQAAKIAYPKPVKLHANDAHDHGHDDVKGSRDDRSRPTPGRIDVKRSEPARTSPRRAVEETNDARKDG